MPLISNELRDFSLAAPSGVSRAFVEIRDYVDSRYHDSGEQYRDLIFYIAYAEYCVKKKNNLYRTHRTYSGQGIDLDPSAIQSILAGLCHLDEYGELCDKAEIMLKSLEDRVSTIVVAQITGVIAAEMHQFITDEIKPNKEHGFIDFIKKSGLHALEIVTATLILFLVYKILSWIMPTIEEIVQKYLGKIISLF